MDAILSKLFEDLGTLFVDIHINIRYLIMNSRYIIRDLPTIITTAIHFFCWRQIKLLPRVVLPENGEPILWLGRFAYVCDALTAVMRTYRGEEQIFDGLELVQQA